jgi:hypothetical protein
MDVATLSEQESDGHRRVSASSIMKIVWLKLTCRFYPNELINKNFTKYDESTGYSGHTIGKDKIMVQLGRLLTHTYILLNLIYLILLLAQPYLLSSMKLLLWDGDGRSYR